jgi:OmpA-OmpF porin, OOP family
MHTPIKRLFTLAALASLALGLALGMSSASAQDTTTKEKVLGSADVTADALVDALDIGGPAAPDGATTRGFRPATASNAPRVGGTSSSGKAPLMITFRTGSAELTPESMAVMGKVANALQSDRLAGFAFKVEGHADPRGGEDLNQRLSQARAESVVKHLIASYGILPERLTAVGRGSAELYDATHPEAPENRRVTIVTQR